MLRIVTQPESKKKVVHSQGQAVSLFNESCVSPAVTDDRQIVLINDKDFATFKINFNEDRLQCEKGDTNMPYHIKLHIHI